MSEEKRERAEVVVDEQEKCIHMHTTWCALSSHGQVVQDGNFAPLASLPYTQCPCTYALFMEAQSLLYD